MQYVGGKQKSGGDKIAVEIHKLVERAGAEHVIEQCCGGLSVTQRLGDLEVTARDACVPLITLYKAMQAGWVPPAEVDRETWERYRGNPDPEDPMTAFVGFGCSRSGAWFSGFIADYKYTHRRVPAATAARDSLLRKLACCKDVTFTAGDYADAPVRGIWYCDIPYVDSLGYPAVGTFDHARFWLVANDVSLEIPVLVSERVAPADWVAIREWSVQSRIATTSGGRRDERLFLHERWAP